MDKLRVVLADDHPLVLMAAREVLETLPYIEILGSVSNSTDLMAFLEEHTADVVITDYSMPGDSAYGDGMRLIKFLLRKQPNLHVFVLTMVTNPMIITAMYDAGVAAVVLKRDNFSEIATAIAMLQIGRKYYPPGFEPGQLTNLQKSSAEQSVAALSPSEFEVLRQFVAGTSVSEIAHNRNRSVKTISAQKASAMRKLGVRTDQELVAFCTANSAFG